MNSIEEQIQKCTRYDLSNRYDMRPCDEGEWLSRIEVLDTVSTTWQTERPTEGRWYVSIHPKERGRFAEVIETIVHNDKAWMPSAYRDGFVHLSDPMFVDALWCRREDVPMDPFKDS